MPAPTIFTDDLAALICERLADGQSLREVCRADDMPGRDTVRRWVRDNPEFRQRYTEAMQARPDAFLEQIIDIASDETKDVQHRRLQIATLQWAMSKCAPKKYGDKVTHASDPDAPLIPACPDDLARRLAFLFTKGDEERKRQAESQDP